MLVGSLALESFHADIGVFQHGVLRNVIHLIFTILIGYCAHTAASHLDRNSDERISITVEYLSAHLALPGAGLLSLVHDIDAGTFHLHRIRSGSQQLLYRLRGRQIFDFC